MAIASSDTTADLTQADTPHTVALREYVANYYWTLLGVALTVFGVFLPTVIRAYPFNDDYTDLYIATGWGATTVGDSIVDGSAVTGRPFSGFLIQWFFAAAGTIENLRFVRLVAVLTIAALALLLHWALVRAGVRSLLAALIALLLCTLPPFQVYASWAVLFSAPLGAFLAGIASLFAVAAVDGRRDLRLDRALGAVFLMLAALFIYQPAAMFFWVFFAIALLGAARDSTRSMKLVKMHFVVAFAALALAYLQIKLTVRVLGDETAGANRNTLSHDVVGKAEWFFRHALYNALSLFDITPTPWFAALVALVAGSGIVLWLLRHGARPLLYAVVGIVLIPLSYMPNLVVTDKWPAYRTQVAVDALLALYACLGAYGLWLALAEWLKPRLTAQAFLASSRAAVALSTVFVATSVFIAGKNVTTLIVRPQLKEQQALRSQVAALPTGVSRVAYVQTDCYSFSRENVYDEFGIPTSTRPWTFAPAVALILHEQGRLTKADPRPAVDILPVYTPTLPTDEPVIDLRGSMLKLC